MKLHICMLDKDCRRWGKPKRIYLFTKHHEFGLAYAKGDKFITSKANDLPLLPAIRTAWWYHERKS